MREGGRSALSVRLLGRPGAIPRAGRSTPSDVKQAGYAATPAFIRKAVLAVACQTRILRFVECTRFAVGAALAPEQ